MDLLQIWCIERSQWPDKQLRSQSAGRVVRRSGGQFSALIAKSGEQVGGWRLESCCGGAVASLRGLAGRSRSSTASEVKVPIQPFQCCCCCDTISKQQSTAPPASSGHGKPRNVCQAVTNSCQKLSPNSCKAVTLPKNHPFTPPLSTISHQAARPEPLAAQSFPLKHLRRNNRILTQCNDFVSEAMRPSKHKFVA